MGIQKLPLSIELQDIVERLSQPGRSNEAPQRILLCRRALELVDRGAHPDLWAAAQNELANSLAQNPFGNRAENLEQAIDHYRQALQVKTQTAYPADWVLIQNNLGNVYRDRIRGERAENLEQAIFHYRQALELVTREVNPADWAMIHNNLGIAYSYRIRSERAENLEQAISHFHQALEEYTREALPEDWAITQNNLANVYKNRMQGERAENLEQAIEFYLKALEVITRERLPVEWSMIQNNLANAYRNRIRGERAENIEQAIYHSKQALEVRTRAAYPADWALTYNNLGNAYAERIQGERVENIEQAIHHYQQSLEVFRPESHPFDCRRTGRSLGQVALPERRWQTGLSGLLPAIAADRLLFQAATSLESREAELSNAAGIYILASYALAQTGRLGEALETIEAGQARILSETLERNRRDLERLPELGQAALLERYRQAGAAFESLGRMEETAGQDTQQAGGRSDDRLEHMADARAELNAVINEIRQVPGYEDFLLPLSASRIQALAEEAPLVYVAATPAGGLALLATGQGVQPVWLNDLTEESLRQQLIGGDDQDSYLRAYIAWNNELTDDTTFENWKNAVDDTTNWLWGHMMQPLIEKLQGEAVPEKPVILIPAGLLALLPLHAAWEDDPARPGRRHYALDDFTFTYAPSARALLEARQVAEAMDAQAILAIDNPHKCDPGLSLPFSKYEVNAALAFFESQKRVRLEKKATLQALQEALAQFSVLHFSTHGRAGWDRPLESALLLADGELTLNELLKLRLPGARLAVLSACETGIPGIELPEEVVSLPSGLLQAGVAGVAASLWPVADISTAMLMARFYALWRKEGLPPHEALRQAQIWLRDTSNGQKKVYFKDELPEFTGYFMPEAQVDALLASWFGEDDEAKSYTHPFYWAAFTYTGV
jgi:CHAT domain-containing protein/tetratricopeptide (TPR) repeat protein